MTPSSANERQVGGRHYQTGGEQHWDRIWRLYGPGYFVGCITKYLERYPDKNGYQDLLKAQHFLEKLIELEGAKPKGEAAPDYVNQDRGADSLVFNPSGVLPPSAPPGRRF